MTWLTYCHFCPFLSHYVKRPKPLWRHKSVPLVRQMYRVGNSCLHFPFFLFVSIFVCQVYSRGSASNGKLFCISPLFSLSPSTSLPLSRLFPPYPLSSFSRSPPLFPLWEEEVVWFTQGSGFRTEDLFSFYCLWRRKGESCFCNRNCTKQWWRLDQNGKHLRH